MEKFHVESEEETERLTGRSATPPPITVIHPIGTPEPGDRVGRDGAQGERDRKSMLWLEL